MSDFILSPRSLTPDEANLLHLELKTTPNILGYAPRELLKFSYCLVACDAQGNFAGACLTKDLAFNWTDIALLYVLPAFRGRGLSRSLWEAAFLQAQKRGRHIYVLSRSPQIIHLMEAQMQTTRSPWKTPFAVILHSYVHMASLYRWREAFRKTKLRQNDKLFFVAGTAKTPRRL